jgi:hypothetical protein
MTRTTIVMAAGLALVAVLSAAPALAQRARVFVASYGNDTNPCTFGSPCKTFQYAVNVVATGGEVTAIDSAGFGPVTINKAVSIVSPAGVEAGIVPGPSGIGIAINFDANPGDVVRLSGLTIDGGGIGVVGIQFTSNSALTIENCVIRHVLNDGIDFDPTGTSNLSISDSVISDNGLSGIAISTNGTEGAAVTAALNRIQVINNSYQGVYVEGDNGAGTLNVTVSESVSENNAANGYYASSASGHATTTLSVFHSVSASNVNGLVASGVGATVRVAQSMITGNAHQWQALTNGVIQTYLDNYIDTNGTNTGNLTSVPKQ